MLPYPLLDNDIMTLHGLKSVEEYCIQQCAHQGIFDTACMNGAHFSSSIEGSHPEQLQLLKT